MILIIFDIDLDCMIFVYDIDMGTIQKLKQDINRNKLRKYDATQCIKTLNNQNSVYKYGKIEYNV